MKIDDFIKELKRHPDLESDPTRAFLELWAGKINELEFHEKNPVLIKILDSLEIDYRQPGSKQKSWCLEDKHGNLLGPISLGSDIQLNHKCIYQTPEEASDAIKKFNLKDVKLYEATWYHNWVVVQYDGIPYLL